MPKKRADGRYCAKITYTNEFEVKETKYVYASSQKELTQKVTETRTKLKKGIDITADKDSFDFWGQNGLNLNHTK